MIAFAILLLVAIIIIVLMASNEEHPNLQIAYSLFGLVFFIVLLMIFRNDVIKLRKESKTAFFQDYKYDILALNDSKDINGGFSGSVFATRGYINTEMYYYFIINTVKGKYMSKELASRTYIDEKENVKPNIYCGHYIWPDENFWRDIFYGLEIDATHECYMTVPPGTITDNYIIDLQ
jgi:hypothetical protein